MSFLFSKLIWLVINPKVLITILLFIGAILIYTSKYFKYGITILTTTILIVFLVSLLSIGSHSLRILENFDWLSYQEAAEVVDEKKYK